jgi:hypothetical protein
MPEHLKRAIRYRNRAAELRAIAEKMHAGEPHDKIVELATQYDQMAADEEARSGVKLSDA